MERHSAVSLRQGSGLARPALALTGAIVMAGFCLSAPSRNTSTDPAPTPVRYSTPRVMVMQEFSAQPPAPRSAEYGAIAYRDEKGNLTKKRPAGVVAASRPRGQGDVALTVQASPIDPHATIIMVPESKYPSMTAVIGPDGRARVLCDTPRLDPRSVYEAEDAEEGGSTP